MRMIRNCVFSQSKVNKIYWYYPLYFSIDKNLSNTYTMGTVYFVFFFLSFLYISVIKLFFYRSTMYSVRNTSLKYEPTSVGIFMGFFTLVKKY